jgi:cytochrome c biogenesis protein CcmG, thiol:disulfide interchange protein DsbE
MNAAGSGPAGDSHISKGGKVAHRFRNILMPVVIAGMALSCGMAEASDVVPLRVGSLPPTASLPAVSGPAVTIPQDVRGKVVVLHFWSAGCTEGCRTELSDLEALYRSCRDRGLVVLAVNVGQRGDAMTQFVKPLNLTYQLLLDPASKTAKLYDVVGLPRTFILDRNGIIRYKIVGGASGASLRKMVLSLM